MTRPVSSCCVVIWMTAFGSACSPAVSNNTCFVGEGPSLTFDESSALGFSAADVVASLDLDHTVEVSDRNDLSIERHFVFAYTPEGQASVTETRPDPECESYPQGSNLYFEGVLSLVVDGWLAASGDAIVVAAGPSADRTWVYADLKDQSSSPAAEAVLPEFPGCSGPEAILLTVVQYSLPETPWSSGPIGGVNGKCGGMGNFALFEWGEVSFYDYWL